MLLFSLLQALLFCVYFAVTAAFISAPISSSLPLHGLCACKDPKIEPVNWRQPTQAAVASTRRDLMLQGLAVTAGFCWTPLTATALEENIPMLTTDQFLVIVRDSARSIQRVEFDGPKGETVRVRLIDGTSFGLNDVIESPIDPRSPLKVQAACREAKSKSSSWTSEILVASVIIFECDLTTTFNLICSLSSFRSPI
jgi:hypothetical protein